MKKHGCLWWVCIGWWWVPITLPFRIPMALIRYAKKQARAGKCEQVSAEPENGEETLRVAGISHRSEALEALGKKNPDFTKSEQEMRDADLIGTSVWEYSFSPAGPGSAGGAPW